MIKTGPSQYPIKKDSKKEKSQQEDLGEELNNE